MKTKQNKPFTLPTTTYKIYTSQKFPDRVFMQIIPGKYLSVSVQQFISMVTKEIMEG